ncbi:MAG TPA: hypothetical protein VIX62_11540 [Actinomycetota bacterium]
MDERVSVQQGVVGAVSAGSVDIRNAGIGAVAGHDVSITNGGTGAIAAAGDVNITNGGSGPIAALGSISITNGGAQTIATIGGATLHERSFVAFVLAPKVTIEDGARVFMTTRQAMAAGAAFAVVLGVLTRRSRRRR